MYARSLFCRVWLFRLPFGCHGGNLTWRETERRKGAKSQAFVRCVSVTTDGRALAATGLNDHAFDNPNSLKKFEVLR